MVSVSFTGHRWSRFLKGNWFVTSHGELSETNLACLMFCVLLIKVCLSRNVNQSLNIHTVLSSPRLAPLPGCQSQNIFISKNILNTKCNNAKPTEPQAWSSLLPETWDIYNYTSHLEVQTHENKNVDVMIYFIIHYSCDWQHRYNIWQGRTFQCWSLQITFLENK